MRRGHGWPGRVRATKSNLTARTTYDCAIRGIVGRSAPTAVLADGRGAGPGTGPSLSLAPPRRLNTRMTNALGAKWVADRDSAAGAARVIVKECYRPWRLSLLVGGTILMVVSSIPMLGGDLSLLDGAYLGAATTVVLVNVVGAARLWATALKNARVRFPEGVVIESSFDTQCVTLQGPYSERRIPYSAIEAARVVGRWVLIRERGIPNASVLPLDLFPDQALEQIRGSIDPARVRSAS